MGVLDHPSDLEYSIAEMRPLGRGCLFAVISQLHCFTLLGQVETWAYPPCLIIRSETFSKCGLTLSRVYHRQRLKVGGQVCKLISNKKYITYRTQCIDCTIVIARMSAEEVS